MNFKKFSSKLPPNVKIRAFELYFKMKKDVKQFG